MSERPPGHSIWRLYGGWRLIVFIAVITLFTEVLGRWLFVRGSFAYWAFSIIVGLGSGAAYATYRIKERKQ